MRWSTIGTVFVALTATALATAGDLPSVPAKKVGMSPERLEAITRLSEEFVDEGKLPNVVTLVSRAGKVVHFSAVGQRGVEDPRPIKRDDLFRIYSQAREVKHHSINNSKGHSHETSSSHADRSIFWSHHNDNRRCGQV